MESLNIAESLKRARQKFNLSQADMANFLNSTPQNYAELEISGKRDPRISTLYKIASGLNVSLDYLTGLTDEPRPINQILAEMATAPNSVESSVVNQLPNSTQAGDYQNQITAMQTQIKSMQAQINNLQSKLDKVSKIFATD